MIFSGGPKFTYNQRDLNLSSFFTDTRLRKIIYDVRLSHNFSDEVLKSQFLRHRITNIFPDIGLRTQM
jgi:hypothetical protein